MSNTTLCRTWKNAVLKLKDRKKINEKDNAYIDYVMMKPGAIVELDSDHILSKVES